jgi:hypothetical protein
VLILKPIPGEIVVVTVTHTWLKMVYVLVVIVMRDLISMLVVLMRECTMLLDGLVNVLLLGGLILCKLMTTLVDVTLVITGTLKLTLVGRTVVMFHYQLL